MTDRPDSATVQLKIRVKETVRQQLEAAAKANDWPLNKEVERRLNASFDLEGQLGGGEALAFFRATAGAIHLAESRTGRKWTEDTATWFAAKSLMEKQVQNWRPAPPNSQGIMRALREKDEAEKTFAEAYDAYKKKYPATEPVAGNESVPINALLRGYDAAPTSTNVRWPRDAKDEAEREAMQAALDRMDAAFVRLKIARDAVEAAFEQYDAAIKDGSDLASELLGAIDAVVARERR